VVGAVGFAIFILAGAGTTRAQEADLARKLTLKEAVNLAVANSRDLALARLQYGVMQRQIGVARSAFLPNLYTGTGVAYTSGFPLLEGGGAPAIFSLSYTQQIFNPPLKGEQRAAEQRAEEQRLSMDDVRDSVMSRAALDYLELAKVRHALELMHSERTSAGRIDEALRSGQVGRQVTREMAAENGVEHERDAVQHEDPCEEEMPCARHRQPLHTGNGDPPGKRRAHGLAAGGF